MYALSVAHETRHELLSSAAYLLYGEYDDKRDERAAANTFCPKYGIEERECLEREECDAIDEGDDEAVGEIFQPSHTLERGREALAVVIVDEETKYSGLHKADECHGSGCHTRSVGEDVDDQAGGETPYQRAPP